MSTEALAIALHHSRARGTARLVLIGIANHDGDGGAWPSIATLSVYAGGVDERNVRRALRELEDMGEVKCEAQQGGTHLTRSDRRPNLYLFLLACPDECDRTKNHRPRVSQEVLARASERGGEYAPPSDSRGGGSARNGGAVAPPEPSLEPKDSREGGDEVQGRAPEDPTPSQESAQEDLGGRVPAELPNPSRCGRHQLTLEPPPCAACRDARVRVELEAEAANRRAVQEQRDREAADRAHRFRIIDACAMCDDQGKLANGLPCHHNPEQDAVNARGRARVAAELERIRRERAAAWLGGEADELEAGPR